MVEQFKLFTPDEKANYPVGFFRWVNTFEGKAVWNDFEARALEMAQVRKRYSASAIAQVIRWHTALRGGDDFKINNNWIPGLARLWLKKHGRSHPGFFELRASPGTEH